MKNKIFTISLISLIALGLIIPNINLGQLKNQKNPKNQTSAVETEPIQGSSLELLQRFLTRQLQEENQDIDPSLFDSFVNSLQAERAPDGTIYFKPSESKTFLSNLSSNGDVEAPQLLEFDFTPKTINTSYAPQTVTFTFRITDNSSGLSLAFWYLYSPSGQQIRYGGVDRRHRISGDALDGVYQGTVEFPQYSEEGTWYVGYMWMGDKAGNRGDFNEQDLINLGFPTKLEVISVPDDIIPPQLREFSFSPTHIDTSEGPQTVTFTLRTTDDLSGFSFAFWDIYSPSGQQIRYGGVDQWDRISGDALDGVYQWTIEFPQYSEGGTWHVDNVLLFDNLGNGRILEEQDFINLGFPTKLEVISVPEDIIPSQLMEFDFTPKNINTSDGPQAVTFTFRTTDDLSGFDAVDWDIYSPSGQEMRHGFVSQWDRISGDALDGVYQGTIEFSQYSETGTWYVGRVFLFDKVGNTRRLFEQDLIDLGFPTKLEIGEAAPDLSITSKPLEFFNDEPYLPNVLEIRALVVNEGNAEAENVIVEFTLDGEPLGIGLVDLDSLGPGEEDEAIIKWETDSNVENAIIRAEAVLLNQTDADLSNNVITQPVSFYWADSHYDSSGFRHDRDAFWFENWSYSSLGDAIEEWFSFALAQWIEKDILTAIRASHILSPIISYIIGAKGYCHGMAASSLSYYLWPNTKPSNLVDKPTFSMEKEEVKPDIIERQWEQLLVSWTGRESSFDPSSEYEDILHNIRDLNRPVLLALDYDGEGGHSVVAYKILDLGEDEKRVFVYENNLPYDDPFDAPHHYPDPRRHKKEDYYITFNLLSKEVSYTVKYSEEEEYEFNRAFAVDLWKIVSLEELKGYGIKNYIYDAATWFFNKLIEWGKMIISVRLSPATTLITDEYGRRIGYVNGAFINEIPGAEMEQQLDLHLFYLPSDLTYSVDITGTDTGAVGLNFVAPISESQVKIAFYEDIPVSLGSEANATINPTDFTYQVVLDTGEILEPEGAGEFDTSSILDAKGFKIVAAGTLKAAKISYIDYKVMDKEIDSIIKYIEKSLNDKFWQDDSHLDPRYGRKVFQEEHAAVVHMHYRTESFQRMILSTERLIERKQKRGLDTVKEEARLNAIKAVLPVFEEVIADLVKADELLAKTVIDEAKDASIVNPRFQRIVDWQIKRAEDELSKAYQELEKNKPDRAIKRFENAWKYAQLALRFTNK